MSDSSDFGQPLDMIRQFVNFVSAGPPRSDTPNDYIRRFTKKSDQMNIISVAVVIVGYIQFGTGKEVPQPGEISNNPDMRAMLVDLVTNTPLSHLFELSGDTIIYRKDVAPALRHEVEDYVAKHKVNSRLHVTRRKPLASV